MINRLIVLLLIGVVFSQNCLQEWLNEKSNILDNKIYHVKCSVIQNNNINDFSIIIDKNDRFKIEYLDKIIISDNDKIFNYSKDTNQLFIEKADKNLNRLIYLFSSREDLIKNIKKIKKKQFRLKKKYGDIKLLFNDGCDSLSISIEKKENIIEINNVSVDSIYITNTDSLFKYNFNENEVFKYDFR